MARKEGSGLHHRTTSAIENLSAAIFLGDQGLTKKFAAEVDRQMEQDRSGVSGDDVVRRVTDIAGHLGLSVIAAQTPCPDHLGDIRLTLTDGSFVWIEVKAATTKNVSRLVETDWVRDQTDALRWLVHNEPTVHAGTPPWLLEELDVYNRTEYFEGWDFANLWLADIALLPTRSYRERAGVRSPSDFDDFLRRKFVLHIGLDAARVTRLDMLRTVQALRAGEGVRLDGHFQGKAAITAWLTAGSTLPRRGRIDFIYYAGYPKSSVVGRHKLTDYCLRRSDGLYVCQ